MSYNTKNKLRIFAENATPNESNIAGLIYSDATWAENVNRLNGEKKGVAPSIDFNTALKQATLGSTVLGDIIAKRYDIIMSSELQEGATTNYKSFEDYVSDISEKFAFGNLLGSKEVKKSNLADDILKGTFDGMTVGISKYASADKTKGTIEDRLTKLGFKEGSISLASTITASTNYVKRQGNYVFGSLSIVSTPSGFATNVRLNYNNTVNPNATVSTIKLGSIPIQFRPKTSQIAGVISTVKFYIANNNAITSISGEVTLDCLISTSGELTLRIRGNSLTSTVEEYVSLHITEDTPLILNFGYEANPIT